MEVVIFQKRHLSAQVGGLAILYFSTLPGCACGVTIAGALA
jgi:hypothetical protein